MEEVKGRVANPELCLNALRMTFGAIVMKDLFRRFAAPCCVRTADLSSWNAHNCYISLWRTGGMPQMVFEYILKKQGIDPKKDLTIIQNIDFGLTSQAFAAGEGDYTIEFEPAATGLELEGAGKVVASLGVESGKVPYTAFSAKKSYIKKNPEIIQKFTNAIQKGMDYVQSHTPGEIADAIAPQFKETDKDTLVMIVTRYYEQDTWKDNLIFEKESLELLQDILDEAGELTARVPYEDIVTTEYADKAKK